MEKFSSILLIENDAGLFLIVYIDAYTYYFEINLVIFILEIECFLQSIFSVIYTSEGLDAPAVINKVIAALTSASSKSTAKSSLKALVVVFNLAFDPLSKYSCLLGMLILLLIANSR